MFKVDIKSSTGVVYVGVVISNVMGGCPVSLGVIKAAGVRGVSRSDIALQATTPPAPRAPKTRSGGQTGTELGQNLPVPHVGILWR